MSKLLKALISLVTLIFTIVLVAFLYAINLDPNSHKATISRKFEEITGLTLVLNGDIQLELYPWLGLTLENVLIQSPDGFSGNPLLQAEHAKFRTKLLPLLDREYEIDTIELTGTRLHLETNITGQGNWELPVETGKSDQGNAQASPVFNELVLGGVDIRDAGITFDDRFNDVIYELDNITVNTGELVYGEPVSLSMGLSASSSRPLLSSRLQLSGTLLYDLANERYDLDPLTLSGTLSGNNVPGGTTEVTLSSSASLDFANDLLTLRNVSFSALDTRINANINGRNFSGTNPFYQINLAAAGADLAVVFRILENEALVDQITNLDNRGFTVSGLFESSPAEGTLAINNLDANLLDSSIKGDISATNLLAGSPVIRGSINAAGPDLPTLLEVAGQLQGGRNSALATYGRDLQQSPNQAFLLETTFDANLETGNISVPALIAQALGTNLDGNVSASGINTDTPVFQGHLNASGPDLPLILQIAGQVTGGHESSLNQLGRQLRQVDNKGFDINAPFDIDMKSGNIDVSGIDASFLGFTLNGSLQARNFQAPDGTMGGRITLSGKNLESLLEALDRSDLAEVVQSVTLETAVDGTRENLSMSPFTLDLTLDGPDIPNGPVTLALNTSMSLNLEDETVATSDLSLAGLGLDLGGNLNATNILDNPGINGQIRIAPFNLRRFMQQINQPLPVTSDGTVFRSLALSSNFSASADNMQLDNLTLALDDSTITGNLTLAGLDNDLVPPASTFDLSVTSLNLDRYLEPEEESSVNNSVGNTPLPVDTLRNLNLKGQVRVEHLTYSNLNLDNLSLAINASDGELALAPINANLYQGSYTGDIRLSTGGSIPVASLDTRLENIYLAPLLRDFMDASYVSGTGDIRLNLAGRGEDTATIKRNLNGTGSMALHDGILEGVDVGSVLAQVETMIREQRPANIVRGERTPFDTFSASVEVQNGIVTTDDLLIESSGFDVSGRGILANLTNDTINFNLVANVDESPATDERAYDIGGYALPIACTGALAEPSCLPDIQAIIAGAIQSAIQRGLTDLLQRAIGDEVSESTGSDTSTEPTPQQEEQQPLDPREELLNRALESLFKR